MLEKILEFGLMHENNIFFYFFKCNFLFFFKIKLKIKKNRGGLGQLNGTGWPSQPGPNTAGLSQVETRSIPTTNSHEQVNNSPSSLHVNSNRWSTNHNERFTYHCCRVEEVEVVLYVAVESKMVACGGREELLKRLTSVGICGQ